MHRPSLSKYRVSVWALVRQLFMLKPTSGSDALKASVSDVACGKCWREVLYDQCKQEEHRSVQSIFTCPLRIGLGAANSGSEFASTRGGWCVPFPWLVEQANFPYYVLQKGI